jgi:GTP cyclohydrolase I
VTTTGLPHDRPAIDRTRIAALYRELLTALGEDPEREGLRRTPERAAGFWSEFLDHDPGETDTVFARDLDSDTNTETMVLVGGIAAWSVCEHHLLPMRLHITAAYFPGGSVLGLSKFARIAGAHCHGLQLQERVGDGITNDIAKATGSEHVGVVIEGEHLCMSMRGVREPQARTISTSLTGRFRQSDALADRLLHLARTTTT